MLRNVTCLLIENENNYILTPYTDEDDKKEPGKILFSFTNSLTAITVWPHKDEENGLDDVRKQLCLKFIELKNMVYAANLRATSTANALMEQLTESQKAFVDAVMLAYAKVDNKKWTHPGRSFSTEIVQVNIGNVAIPEGFVAVNKKLVNDKAFNHASLEALKTSVGWPAMAPLSAEPSDLFDAKIFHPFALQLNNTINGRSVEADNFAADEIKEFKSQYAALQESAKTRSSEQFQQPITADEAKSVFAPFKQNLEAKLSMRGVAAKAQMGQQ